VRKLAKVVWQEMATSVSVATSYAAMTGSPFTPKASGRLRALRLMASGDAATALIEGVLAKLSCGLWGYDVHIGLAGAGIRTAPAFPIPIEELEVDLPVNAGNPITLELINQTGDTPVTPRYNVMGCFEYQT